MYRLSVEEVAFAMGLFGDYEIAAGYLIAALGQMEKENLSGRLAAASHSLLARELFHMKSEEDGELVEDLARLVQAMTLATRSVRCEQRSPTGEQVMTCFVHRNDIVYHALEQNVVAVLKPLGDANEVLQTIIDFVDAETEGAVSEPLGTTYVTTLQSLRDLAQGDQKQRMLELATSFLNPSDAQQLVADFVDPSITWGSILFLETATGKHDAPLLANNGVLYALVSERLWLFLISTQTGDQVTVYRDGKGALRQLLSPLVTAWFGR